MYTLLFTLVAVSCNALQQSTKHDYRITCNAINLTI